MGTGLLNLGDFGTSHIVNAFHLGKGTLSFETLAFMAGNGYTAHGFHESGTLLGYPLVPESS
jgi:hypothetical protein